MHRPFLFTACVAFSAVVSFCQSASDPKILPLGIFMDFDVKPGEAAVKAMEDEVVQLLHSTGIDLNWRLTRENRGNEIFSNLVVLKFKGLCRAGGPLPASPDFGTLGETRTLGATKVVKGHVLPYSVVECDEVRQALSYLTPRAGLNERQHALGVALGRVVAHELYHVLAGTTRHAAQGLAKATESLGDLISSRGMPLGEEDSKAIREHLNLR